MKFGLYIKYGGLNKDSMVFSTYKENLDENDLVREFSREEYLKELKSDISGKSAK